jgi:GntR family transcriptional regulator, arabinose operon transcriptional repressor
MSDKVVEDVGPIYMRVRDSLIEEIQTLEKGSKLPSERELSQMFGVDRMSIRRALKDLQDEGYVVRYHGKGTYTHKPVMPGASTQVDPGLVGLVVPCLEISYYTEMVQGIRAEAASRGYSLVVCDALFDTDREKTLLEYISQQPVGRMLVVPFFKDSVDPEYSKLIQRIAGEGVRVVLVDQCLLGLDIPSVTVDKVRTGYIAAEHLIMLGHRRIAYASSMSYDLAGRDHLRGFKMALRDNDVDFREDLVFDISPVKCAAPMQAAVTEKMSRDPKAFTAFATPYFSMAYGVIKAANQLGIRIPDDLALVGGEAQENPDYSYLTYTRSPRAQLGSESVKMLLRDEDDEAMQRHKLIKPELIIGTTCGATILA